VVIGAHHKKNAPMLLLLIMLIMPEALLRMVLGVDITIDEGCQADSCHCLT
jgi:hypothetical protein